MNAPELLKSKPDQFEGVVPVRSGRTLHSRKAMEDALRREYERAERTARPFCCVVFQLHSKELGRRSFQRLFNLLDQRCRSIDEIGWFDDDALCALLPETDEPGAQSVAADIMDAARQVDLSPSVRIYSYGVKSTLPGGPGSGLRDLKTIQKMTEVGVELNSRRAFRPHRKIHSPFPVSRMEALFCVPLPLWKRAIDIGGAGVALALSSPLILLIAALIKCSEPNGSVFFKQRRAGLGGRPFTMIKFRTMCMDAEARKEQLRAISEQDGPAFKISADPRITPLGRILRKTSLDELPQLFNVLSGNMSLVGPRPPTLDEVAKYKPWYHRRLAVTPGITCIWQVEGRSSVTFEEWMRMDAQYVRQGSLWRDLQLLARTLPAVLLQRGAC